MCGGAGTRLDADREKPLVPVGGTPMVDRVIDALDRGGADRVLAVTGPDAPDTRTSLADREVETIVGSGEGYVPDLQAALADDRIQRPVLTAAADLPLLTPTVVESVLATHRGGSMTVAVPVATKRRLAASLDDRFDRHPQLAPSGLNVVGDGPAWVSALDHAGLAVNVNRPADLRLARRLAKD